MASVPILSQVVKIKMEVQVSNAQGIWLYLSDASPIIKQWEEVEEENTSNWKCEIWSKAKKKIKWKINKNLNAKRWSQNVIMLGPSMPNYPWCNINVFLY